eukprot:7376533-Prymnesium_polylepis.1
MATRMVMLINDKNDGFLDELLPHIRIVTRETLTGCAEGLARGALEGVMAQEPRLIGTVGPGCSNDVADVSDRDYRETIGSRIVHISFSSTATSIADSTLFPNVARLATNDFYMSQALAQVCDHYSWTEVSILYDFTRWSNEFRENFLRNYLATLAPDGRTKVVHDIYIENEDTFDPLSCLQAMAASTSKVALMSLNLIGQSLSLIHISEPTRRS